MGEGGERWFLLYCISHDMRTQWTNSLSTVFAWAFSIIQRETWRQVEWIGKAPETFHRASVTLVFFFNIRVLNQQAFLRSDVNTDKTSMTRVMQRNNHCLIFAFRAANASCSRSSSGATFLMSVHSEYFVYLRKMFVAEGVRNFSSFHSPYYGF